MVSIHDAADTFTFFRMLLRTWASAFARGESESFRMAQETTAE